MTRLISKILASSLILALIFPVFFQPHPVDAQLGSIVRVASCTSGGLVAPWLSDQIESGLKSLAKKLPGAIAGILGLGGGGVLGTVPVNDANFQGKWTGKEYRMDIIARCTAREIYDKMVGNTLNVVRNHGRDGGPIFVKNWRNFFTGSQYRGENVFRAMLSNTQLCGYFEQDIKTAFNATNKTALPSQNTRVDNLDPYQLRAGCTMPPGWTLQAYEKDFAGNGGWAAFARLMEPQNNALGAFLMAMDESAKQRGFEQQLDLAEAGGGSGGYTSRRGRGANDSCLVRASNNQCIAYKDILTPGSTLGGSVDSTIQQEMAWITNVDELSEVITSLVGGLLNRMLDLSHNDDGRPINPADLPIYTTAPGNHSDPSLIGDDGPIIQQTPTPNPGDDGSSGGGDGGGGGGGNIGGPLSCSPSSQTVGVGQSASLTANGGDGNYAWHADDGNPTDATGSSYGPTFPKIDDETVYLTSAGVTVQCAVFIR